jgi:hypothetical protein
MTKYTVEITETGDQLEDFYTPEDAAKYVRRQEAIDKNDGTYTKDYYYIRSN